MNLRALLGFLFRPPRRDWKATRPADLSRCEQCGSRAFICIPEGNSSGLSACRQCGAVLR